MARRGAFHYDLEKYCTILCGTENPGFVRKMKLLLTHLGLRCIAVYRFGELARRVQKRHRVVGFVLRAIHLVLNRSMIRVHKVDISTGTEIGPGFHISHAGNIFIGACRIGANCTVTHNVTIGINFQATERRVPIIGDDVWIGTGSVLAGNIIVGDGVAISAGSILTRSVPARCLVAGNPARVINREYDNHRMLVYRRREERQQAVDARESWSGSRRSAPSHLRYAIVEDRESIERQEPATAEVIEEGQGI